MMPEHSPTPFSTMPAAPNNYWVIESAQGNPFANIGAGYQRAMASEQCEEVAAANAAFIVEACNAFEPLLNYVRAFRAFAESAAYSPESLLNAHIRMDDAWLALPDAVREALEGEER